MLQGLMYKHWKACIAGGFVGRLLAAPGYLQGLWGFLGCYWSQTGLVTEVSQEGGEGPAHPSWVWSSPSLSWDIQLVLFCSGTLLFFLAQTFRASLKKSQLGPETIIPSSPAQGGFLFTPSVFLLQVPQVGLRVFGQSLLKQGSRQCWWELCWWRDHAGAEAQHWGWLPRRSCTLLVLLFTQMLLAEGKKELNRIGEGR